MSHSLETMYEIWNDRDGDRIELGPDRDGLGMSEIRLRTDNGKIEARISFNDEQLELLRQAIVKRQEDQRETTQDNR